MQNTLNAESLLAQEPEPQIDAFHHGARSGLLGLAGYLEDHAPIGLDGWPPDARRAWLTGYVSGRKARLSLSTDKIDALVASNKGEG
jgi:hypothetical protein